MRRTNEIIGAVGFAGTGRRGEMIEGRLQSHRLDAQAPNVQRVLEHLALAVEAQERDLRGAVDVRE